MQPRRPSKVRVADDASALVVTSDKASAHKPIMQQHNEHALSPAELRKEGGGSSSLEQTNLPKKVKVIRLGKRRLKL